MPPWHGTTRSQNQLPEHFGSHIAHQQRPASVCEERENPLSLVRSGVEAGPMQRFDDLGLLPDELDRDRVLDYDDPSPAIGEAHRWSAGERRLPRAEELGVGPVEGADRELETLCDRMQIRLAGKVARHHAAAIRDRIPEYGDLRDGRAAMAGAVAQQHGSGGDADDHQRSGGGSCPAPGREESAVSPGGPTQLLDTSA